MDRCRFRCHTAFAAGIAISVFTACSRGSDASEAVIVRDSAGIRIVENFRAAQAEPWQVDAEPLVEIGGDENDSTQLLFRVTGALQLSDQRIVLSHGPAPMVRWYSPDGVFEAGTGRPGGGPGEFGGGESAWIADLWPLPGDSIATWEHPPRRMQVFDPAGRHVRQLVLDLPPDMPVGAYPQIRGRLNGGFAGFLGEPFATGALGTVRRDSLRFIRFSTDGSYAGPIARLPGFRTFTQLMRAPNGEEYPSQSRPVFAPTPLSWAQGDRFFYGAGDRYEIAVFDSVGSLSMLVRQAVEPQPVTPAAVEKFRQQTMARAPDDPGTRREWERILDETPVESNFPAYQRIRVDRTGTLWVQEYAQPGADSVTWSTFDTSGHWLSDVTLPLAWQILDIGADYMLVLWRDDLDVEHVRKHGLRRGS